MVFSRLLLTSGFPVIVFFNCIYDFEHKLEERLKLLDYAKKIEQRTKHGENLQSIFCQISKKDTIRGFYYDTRWILPVTDTTSSIDTTPEILIDTLYTNEDSFCISLLKTSRLHYNDVSDNTENFELIKPFGNDSAKFAFNSILSNCRDTLKYGITTFRENKPKELIISDEKSKEEIIPRVKEVSYDTAITKYFALSSGLNKYAFPSITKFGGLVFWMMLLGSLSLCYLLLIYATNKFFGKNIPGIDDFNTMPVALLKDDKIKYLFVQGAPNADKSFFVQNHLEADKYTFYDKTNPEHTYNAKIFNLTEIPDEEEMSLEKESFEKQLIPAFLQEDNWYYKISKLANKNIECIVFTHFEYKIFDEHTNRHKLNLIENIIRLNKKKIIISSDIDPVEYFHSLKMFMNTNVGNNNKKTESKNDSKIFGKDPDTNASFFEYINRWNNLLGRFANIYINNNSPAVEENKSPADKQNSNDHLNPSETFLKNECCNTGFSDTFKKQFDTVAFNEKNEEDYILKIQSLCDHSYRHIWSSLTKEEQLILYDLAEDGLLNTTNYISLTMLLNKGLVVKDAEGLLMIINRSFRNFILTVVNSDEVKNIEKEISDDHTWNDYKYPVLIILGAFLYFALSSNPEKFGNTLPLISGVAAGITTILKLLSFMKPGETKG